MLEESSKGRIPELVPIRYGRMLRSPFTFYRGAALNMAHDLSRTPTTGLRVQACGDCHLLNFGAFATPERRVIFDINDLDETLPAAWEWDVKRLGASFVLACRSNGFSETRARDAALTFARAYREHTAAFSEMTALDVWYSSIDAEEVLSMLHDALTRKRAEKRLKKARHTTVAGHDFPELVDTSGATPVIKDSPPLIFHPPDRDREEFVLTIHRVLSTYRETLPEYRRVLLDRFQFVDIAVKVVGVGSVGTTCAIVLLMDAAGEPLFLQAKEACPSVLERYAGKSVYENHGQRVVVGYHLMQSASDIFLGWTEGGTGRHFYLRQLRDMKVKPLVESATPSVMTDYAELCGCTLARAHARSGEPAELTGYMGKSDVFDQAIADFSVAYADQSERDHEVFEKAVREGKLEVIVEEP